MGQVLARLLGGGNGGSGGGGGNSGTAVNDTVVLRNRKLQVVRHIADGGFSAVFHVRDTGKGLVSFSLTRAHTHTPSILARRPLDDEGISEIRGRCLQREGHA